MNAPILLPALLLITAAAVAQPPDRTALYSAPPPPAAATLERLNLQTVWTNVILTDGKRDGLLSVQFAPVREGGKTKMRLLVQTRSGVVHELDAETGQILWRVRLGNPYMAQFAVGFNSTEVVAVRGTDVYAVTRKDGDIRWKIQLNGVASGPPLVDSRHVYMNVGTDRVEFWGLPTIEEGKPRLDRSYHSTIPLQLEPGQSESFLFYPSPRGTVSVLDKATSGEYVRYRTGDQLSAGPGMHEAEAGVYIGSMDANLYGFSLNDSEPSWRFATGRPIERKPFVNDEDVFVTAEGRGVYRVLRRTQTGGKLVGILQRKGLATAAQLTEIDKELDKRSGDASAILSSLLQKNIITEAQKSKLRWRGGDDVWLNPDADRVLAANKKFVYAVDRTGALLVVDRERGRTLSRFDTRDFPVPITNELTDRVYLAAHNGRIVCLRDREYAAAQEMKSLPAPPAPPAPPKKDPPGMKDPPPPPPPPKMDKP